MEKQNIVFPDWMNSLPGKAFVGSEELCEMFGLLKRNFVRDFVGRYGLDPVPNECSARKTVIYRGNGRPVKKWKLRDVRALVTKLNSELPNG